MYIYVCVMCFACLTGYFFYRMCLNSKRGLQPPLARGLVCILPQVHHHTSLFQRQLREFSLQLIVPFVDLQSPESKVIMQHKRLNTLIKSLKTLLLVSNCIINTARNQVQMLEQSFTCLWKFLLPSLWL